MEGSRDYVIDQPLPLKDGFSEVEPATLENLSNLKLSDLCSTDVMSLINKTGGQLTKLTLKFITLLPEAILNPDVLGNILEIDISLCDDISVDAVVNILNNCGTKLKVLSIGCSSLSGEGWSQIKPNILENLHSLDLWNCSNITDESVAILINRTGNCLKKINLQNTEIKGRLWRHIRPISLHCIQKLIIGSENLTDSNAVSIINCCGDSLRVIDVRNSKVTGSSWHKIKPSIMSNLKNLRMHCCRQLTDENAVKLINSCQKIEELCLSSTLISDKVASKIRPTALMHLKQLDISQCEKLSSTGIVNLVNKCGDKLKSLDICQTKLTLKGLSSLKSSIRSNLREVYLFGCLDLELGSSCLKPEVYKLFSEKCKFQV